VGDGDGNGNGSGDDRQHDVKWDEFERAQCQSLVVLGNFSLNGSLMWRVIKDNVLARKGDAFFLLRVSYGFANAIIQSSGGVDRCKDF
jgi:hypothetical protein